MNDDTPTREPMRPRQHDLTRHEVRTNAKHNTPAKEATTMTLTYNEIIDAINELERERVFLRSQREIEIRKYDAAPDGTKAAHNAMVRMNELGERIAKIERRQSELTDQLPDNPTNVQVGPAITARIGEPIDLSATPARGAMTEAQAQALAIIENGEPFSEGWYDDGDAESGPSGGIRVGYRWGNAELFITRNGTVLLDPAMTEDDDDPTRNFPEVVHDTGRVLRSADPSQTDRSYVGIGAMIGDHMRALHRNIEHNGVDWVLGRVQRSSERPQPKKHVHCPAHPVGRLPDICTYCGEPR